MLASAVTNFKVTHGSGVLADKVTSEDPKRLDTWKTQLEADAERAQKMARETPPKTLTDPAATTKSARDGGGRRTSEPDPTRDKEHAQTMVLSRHPGTEADDPYEHLSARPAAATPAIDATTDDIVASILKANGGLRPSVPQPSSQSLTGAASPPSQGMPTPERTPAISAEGPLHRVLKGTTLDATLWLPLQGANQSPVKALISGNTYSHNRQWVLIPDGTFAIGTANAVQTYNESRLALAFTELQFPDGSTMPLERNPALDQAGDVGVHDRVNNHYVATFGRAAAVGVLQGLGQWVSFHGFGGTGNNSPVIVAGDVGSSTSNAFNSLLNKMPLPTVEIRAGHQLKIYLTSNIELPAWSRVGEVRPVR
jgi:type IV secretory pathway VirB10-like protein